MAETSYPYLELRALYSNTIISVLVSNGQTLNFPALAGTDTVVAAALAQTLTNKTISGASNTITNIPDSALSANVMLLDNAQTVTGVKTFSTAPEMTTISVSGNTVTLPAAVDTLVGKATTDTLTNKTLASDGVGNIIDANRILTKTVPTLAAGYLYYDGSNLSWVPSITSAGPTIWGTGPGILAKGSQTWEESKNGPTTANALAASITQTTPTVYTQTSKIAAITGLSVATTDSYFVEVEVSAATDTNTSFAQFYLFKPVTATVPTIRDGQRMRSSGAVQYPTLHILGDNSIVIKQNGGTDVTDAFYNVRLRVVMHRSVTPTSFPTLVWEETPTQNP